MGARCFGDTDNLVISDIQFNGAAVFEIFQGFELCIREMKGSEDISVNII